ASAPAAWVTASARSCQLRGAAAGAARYAALVELAQPPRLAAIVDRDPADQDRQHDRDQCIGTDDEGRVGAERHVRPRDCWPAASAGCAPGGAGSRCAWPPDAA